VLFFLFFFPPDNIPRPSLYLFVDPPDILGEDAWEDKIRPENREIMINADVRKPENFTIADGDTQIKDPVNTY